MLLNAPKPRKRRKLAENHRRHRLLKTRDLPAWLRDLVEQHLHTFEHYANPKHAYGMCYLASEDFLEIVQEHLRRDMAFAKKLKQPHITRPKHIRIKSVTSYSFYRKYFNRDVSQHHVAQIGEFYIDWTARQFGKRLSFPRIWK